MLPGILPNPWVIVGVGVAFIGVAVGSFYEGTHYQAMADSDAINKQKIEVANALRENAQHVLDVERDRDAFKTRLELENAQHKTQIEIERNHTLDIIATHGGLYAPGRSGGSCGNPVSKADGTASGASATISYCQLDPDISRRLVEAKAECAGFLTDIHTAQDAIANQPK
jgi:hypothetical protein